MLSYAIVAVYTGLNLNEGARTDHLVFMVVIYLLTDLGPRYAPKSITFSEAFTLATLVTVYASFAIR